MRFSKVDGARRPEGLEESAIVRHEHDRAQEPFERRFVEAGKIGAPAAFAAT